MQSFNTPFNKTAHQGIRSSQSSDSTTTTELTPRQKFLTVLVAVLGSFAVGSIPVVYASPSPC